MAKNLGEKRTDDRRGLSIGVHDGIFKLAGEWLKEKKNPVSQRPKSILPG